MGDRKGLLDVERALTVVIVLLFAFAMAMLVLGELLVAGATFLGLAFAIYLRETR